jgi:HSP20 family protein
MFIPQTRSATSPSWAIDRLLEGFFTDSPFAAGGPAVYPAWNVSEDEKSFRIDAEMPGISRENIEIQVVGDELRLSGKHENETQDEKANVHRRERFRGEFSRALRFRTPIDGDKVEATFTDGILSIVLPKSEAALPRKIRVKAS